MGEIQTRQGLGKSPVGAGRGRQAEAGWWGTELQAHCQLCRGL